jgi:hypothetical protein
MAKNTKDDPVTEIDGIISSGRKKPMNFAMMKSKDGIVLKAHITKSSEVMLREAKQAGGLPAMSAMGVLRVSGKRLELTVQTDDVPSNLPRLAKRYLSSIGLQYKVAFLLPGGLEVGDDEDYGDAEDARSLETIGAETSELPSQVDDSAELKAEIITRLKALAPQVRKLAEVNTPSIVWIDAAYKAATTVISTGEIDKARSIVITLEQKLAKFRQPVDVDALRRQLEAEFADLTGDLAHLAKYASSGIATKVETSAGMFVNAIVHDLKTAGKILSWLKKTVTSVLAEFKETVTSEVAEVKETVTSEVAEFKKFVTNELADIPGREGEQDGPLTEEQKFEVCVEDNNLLGSMTPEELLRIDLTQVDTKVLFSNDKMRQLSKMEFKGTGNPKLKELMRHVESNFSKDMDRESVIEALALIVGVPPTAAQLNIDYDRFIIVRKQQEAIGKVRDEEAPRLDEAKHEDFMASRGQLMFGKVLGDAFGIHEVFAAMLSPTGGLVGPGNNSLHLDPGNPIALHGTVHDASGYLNTFHDEGSGYNYLESEHWSETLGSDSCLSGQITGISFWVKEAGEEYVDQRVDEAALFVDEKLKSARDAVEKEVDERLRKLAAKKEKVVDSSKEAGGKVLNVAESILDSVTKSLEAAADSYKSSTIILERSMRKDAKAKLSAMSIFIWS